MKILMINSVCGIRSTGRICTDIASGLIEKGHSVKIAYARGEVPKEYTNILYKIGNKTDVYRQKALSLVFDSEGFGNKKATLRFIKWMDEYNPDIIHLHNIHGYYINMELLFEYLTKSKKRIIWTLHDCWGFTGHCAYFDSIDCKKWMSKCEKCKLKRAYPSSYFFDKSNKNFQTKKKLYNQIDNMIIVTPSQWLSDLARKSILEKYIIRTVYNGVDTSLFYPRESSFRDRYNLQNKVIVLGVAAIWTERKGFSTFNRLAEKLGEKYQVVLVGVQESQKKDVNGTIICIPSTNSVDELAEIYSAADVYVNPTYADNYPTTNIEAIACGTPVITYNTGGSPESACLFGTSVNKGDEEALYKAICGYDKFSAVKDINVDYHVMVEKYIDLYSEMYNFDCDK